MAYCNFCGGVVDMDAKFCSNCGVSLISTPSDDSQRAQKYEGKVFKCSHCGAAMSSRTLFCSNCGHEKREENPLGSFIYKIEAARRTEDKIEVLKAFVVPNFLDALYEAMYLAQRNINTDAYLSLQRDVPEAKLSDAWFDLLEQVHTQAYQMLKGSKHFKEIDEEYKKTKDKIDSAKKSGKRLRFWNKHKLLRAVIVLAVVLVIGGLGFICYRYTNEEIQLKALVSEVQTYIDDNKYDSARVMANQISARYGTTANQEKWEAVKDNLLDEIGAKETAYNAQQQLNELVSEVEVCIESGDYDTAKLKASQIVDPSNVTSNSEYWDTTRESFMTLIAELEAEASEAEREAELAQLADATESYIEDNEFSSARMMAKQIVYDGDSAESKEKWDATREALLEAITEKEAEAAEAEREAELTQLVDAAEKYIKNYDFSSARMMAKQVVYDGDSAESKEKWDTARQSLLEAITEKEAEYNSIITIFVSSSDLIGTDYTEAVTLLKAMGFVNIETTADQDLITGFISKENRIKTITIDGESEFSCLDTFAKSAEIIITYHAFKD